MSQKLRVGLPTQYDVTNLVRGFSSLTGAAFHVAVMISRCYSNEKGYSYIGAETLARKTGLGIATIFRAIAEISDSEEWEVTVGGRKAGQRALANRYRPDISLLRAREEARPATSFPSRVVVGRPGTISQFELTNINIDHTNLKGAAVKAIFLIGGRYFSELGFCYISRKELTEISGLTRKTVGLALRQIATSSQWDAVEEEPGEIYYYPTEELLKYQRVGEKSSDAEQGFSPERVMERLHRTVPMLVAALAEDKSRACVIALEKLQAEYAWPKGKNRLANEFEVLSHRVAKPTTSEQASYDEDLLAERMTSWILANIRKQSDDPVRTQFSAWMRQFCVDDPYKDARKKFSTSSGLAKASSFSTSMASERVAREDGLGW